MGHCLRSPPCASYLSALLQQVLELGPELPAQDPLKFQWQRLTWLQRPLHQNRFRSPAQPPSPPPAQHISWLPPPQKLPQALLEWGNQQWCLPPLAPKPICVSPFCTGHFRACRAPGTWLDQVASEPPRPPPLTPGRAQTSDRGYWATSTSSIFFRLFLIMDPSKFLLQL